MKQYAVDEELKRLIIRTQYKKHPKWSKRKSARRILFSFAILGGIYGAFGLKNGNDTEFLILNAIGMTFFSLFHGLYMLKH